MADLYSFISSEQVTVLIPPNSTRTEQQVTAQATASGIVFLARFIAELYQYPDEVASSLNTLAQWFNDYAAVPGVAGISAVQEINSQNELEDKIDVTVVSTSGKSSTVFRTFYPTVDFGNVVYDNFAAAVARQRAQLDAVEAA